MELTEKQKRFCDYYIETGNATEAYKKAGYKCSNEQTYQTNASRLLSNAKARAYIDEKIKGKDNKRIMSQNEVLELYTKIARGEEQDIALSTDFEGNIVENKVTPALKERIKALDALAKRYGLNEYNANIVMQNNSTVYDVSKMSIEEIKEVLKKDE